MLKRQKLEKSKLQNSVAPQQDGLVSITIKVKEPGYVPEGVQVRSRIDEYFFTANTASQNFDQLNDDPLVVTFSAASKQRMIR